MVNCRTKGARGEREFCDWLQTQFNLTEKPQRNLEQVRSGGADIYVEPFIFEIKRVERLQLQKWWLQVMKASKKGNVPVVAFRQNGKPWEFLISAKSIGIQYGYVRLQEREFKEWAALFLGPKAAFSA